jgi:hypothetical protein
MEDQPTSILVLIPFWSEPVSPFGSLTFTTFIDGSHVLTMPSALGSNRIETRSYLPYLTDGESAIAEIPLSLALFIQPGRGRMAEHPVSEKKLFENI